MASKSKSNQPSLNLTVKGQGFEVAVGRVVEYDEGGVLFLTRMKGSRAKFAEQYFPLSIVVALLNAGVNSNESTLIYEANDVTYLEKIETNNNFKPYAPGFIRGSSSTFPNIILNSKFANLQTQIVDEEIKHELRMAKKVKKGKVHNPSVSGSSSNSKPKSSQKESAPKGKKGSSNAGGDDW